MSAHPNQELMNLVQLTLALSEVTPETQMGKVKGWDSLRHMKLIITLEKTYGVKIPTAKIRQLTSIDGIAGYLRENGKLA